MRLKSGKKRYCPNGVLIRSFLLFLVLLQMPWKKLLGWIFGLFGKKKQFSLGLYGPPNSGKTTLANRISPRRDGRACRQGKRNPARNAAGAEERAHRA